MKKEPITLHFHSHRESLNDFVATLSDDVDTDDSLLWALDDEFVHRGFLVMFFNHREVHGSETAFV